MLDENLIALNEVPAHLPKRRGKLIHIATVYRWASRGARGRILETCRAGGIVLTSREALQRFLSDSPSPPKAKSSTSHEKAERELAAMGI